MLIAAIFSIHTFFFRRIIIRFLPSNGSVVFSLSIDSLWGRIFPPKLNRRCLTIKKNYSLSLFVPFQTTTKTLYNPLTTVCNVHRRGKSFIRNLSIINLIQIVFCLCQNELFYVRLFHIQCSTKNSSGFLPQNYEGVCCGKYSHNFYADSQANPH